MTIQYEKTKATLELLKLDIKGYIERLEDILVEIDEREKTILDRGAKNERNTAGQQRTRTSS